MLRIRPYDARHSPFWNLAVLTLMAAGIAVAYAAATVAQGLESVWFAILLWVIAAHGIALTVSLFYARYIEPFWIAVRVRTVAFPAKTKLRIAVIGDFHVNEEKGERFIDKAVRQCNALN